MLVEPTDGAVSRRDRGAATVRARPGSSDSQDTAPVVALNPPPGKVAVEPRGRTASLIVTISGLTCGRFH